MIQFYLLTTITMITFIANGTDIRIFVLIRKVMISQKDAPQQSKLATGQVEHIARFTPTNYE